MPALAWESADALGAWIAGLLVMGMGLAAVGFGARADDESGQSFERALDELRSRTTTSLSRARDHRRAAEEAQRSRDEFLAAVSHELKTPLNAIQGFTEVLASEMDGQLTPAQSEDVLAIGDAGDHLKTLIDDVLDTSARRTTQEKLELVDIAPLVREVARIVKGSRRKRETVEVLVEGNESGVTLPGDPRRLRQILLNLGSNAVKYTHRGEVRFIVEVRPDALRIAVRDTGVGIAPQDTERVFRAYERVDSQRGRTEGWGLGLAIADEMARWHGGRIELSSEVGKGSTFTLVLPLGGFVLESVS